MQILATIQFKLKSFEEMMKVMRRLEKPKKDPKTKMADASYLQIEVGQDMLYFNRANLTNTLKITWKTPAQIENSELMETCFTVDFEKWDDHLKTELKGLKEEDLRIEVVLQHNKLAVWFPKSKKALPAMPLEKTYAFEKEKMEWTSFQDFSKWQNILKHANLILKKEENVSPLLLNGMRILLKSKKTINYYFTRETYPVEKFMLDNETVNILGLSVEKSVVMGKKGRRIWLLEERTTGKDKDMLADVAFQVLIKDKGEKGELEEINFHGGGQSFFRINADQVNHYFSYLSSETSQLRVTPVNDKTAFLFEPIPFAKELKLKENEQLLVDEMPASFKQELTQLFEEARDSFGGHHEKTELEKKMKDIFTQYTKENWESILAAYRIVKEEDQKPFKKTWDDTLKNFQKVIYHGEKNIPRIIPIEPIEGEMKPSYFNYSDLNNLFVEKTGDIEVERRNFTNGKGEKGYLWTHNEPMNKTVYIAGYGEPDYDTIQELMEQNTLYDHLDEKTGELII